MCGYCIESANLSNDTMHMAVLPPDFWLLMAANLQDSLDICSAMNSITLQQAEHESMANVICCRGLEVLIAEGYSSEKYQAFLNCPQFLVAVDVLTGEECKHKYLADDSRFDLTAARWLLDKQVFIEDGYFERHINLWTVADGETLLNQYIEFNLKGVGLKRNDLNMIFENTGMMDPIEDVSVEDRQAFSDRFPAFLCALLWLGRQMKEVSLLREIVTRNPIGVPDFDGFDLWLQRRAALIDYDRRGFKFLEKNLTVVRAALFQYIALMRPISEGERAQLLWVLNQLDGDDLHDGFSVRLWLETGDLQQACDEEAI